MTKNRDDEPQIIDVAPETLARECQHCGTPLPLAACEHDCATGEVTLTGN